MELGQPGLLEGPAAAQGFHLDSKVGLQGLTLDVYTVPRPNSVQLGRLPLLSRAALVTPRTVVHQAPPSHRISRAGY